MLSKREITSTVRLVTQHIQLRLLRRILHTATQSVSLTSGINPSLFSDKDGSQFSIINDDDLAVFLEAEDLFENIVRVEINGVDRTTPAEETSPPKRVRIEETNDAPASDSPSNDGVEKVVHPGVVCDCCDSDIVGFRYKCTECFNYDLCMTCEGKMRHRDHVMMRIPAPVQVFSPRDCKRRSKKSEIPQQTSESDKAHRHHHGKRGHHRRPHHRGSFFDGFFRQLNEDSPVSDVETGNQDTSVPPTNGANQTQPEQAQNCAGTSANPQQIPPPYDFHKLVKVVEAVAGNVSKLFDPLATLDAYADYGVNVPPTTTSKAATPQERNVPIVVEKDQTKAVSVAEQKEMEAKAAEASAENAPKPTAEAVAATPISQPASFAVVPEPTITDVVDEVSNQSAIISPTTDDMPMSPSASNNSDDAEWMVISREGIDGTSVEQATQAGPQKDIQPTASTSAQTTTKTSTETSAQTQGYDELARKLQKDIEDQLKLNSSSASTQTSVTPTAPPSGPIVFHPVPHINMSIHKMMDMGFSNDGGCLTELMACCNGDIRRALDTLLYKK